MDHVGGIRVIRPFMALGAYVRVPSRRIHLGVIVVDAGNGFIAMTLTTGDLGPDRVNIPGLLGMAIYALLKPIDVDPPVRISQECPPSERLASWA